MEKVIEVNNLTFGYDGKTILENVYFSVDRGDYVGIIGPNGSGKSTLIKLILKIIPPLNGEIKIMGENIEKFKHWDKLGYISQRVNSFNIGFPATVQEVVGANLFSKVGLFHRLKRNHIEMIENALEIVGMQDYRNTLIGSLSGGQRQRIFIARILISQPEIMFLDEPTAGVDAKSEEAVYCLLGRLNKETGITVVMVTHDIGAITVHANKLACMSNKGVLVCRPGQDETSRRISNLYGYEVNLHIHEHNCKNKII
jgi:zinc transport system ATP-binding protein